jgi:hypothetical protein
MLCLSNEALSLVSAGLISLLSIPIVACFALSLASATDPNQSSKSIPTASILPYAREYHLW